MTLVEARSLIGNAVVYRPLGAPAEQGVVTSVNDYYVFVRYGADLHSKATPPGMLSGIVFGEHSNQQHKENPNG